jgi:hypothetical protein
MNKVIPKSDQTIFQFGQCKDSFLVCALQFNGRGDIHGGHEIALRVQKLMPHAKVVFTVLKPRFTELEALLFQPNKFVDLTQIQKQEGWEIEEEKIALSTIDTFKKIIIFPTYHDTLLPEEILQRNEDAIKLREYSVGAPTFGVVNGKTYTLGLNVAKGEKGVLLPFEYSQKIPPRKNETPLQRLMHLEKIDPAFSKAILDNNFSPAAIESFNKTSKLYFGYFSQPNVFFCFINALLSCKNSNLIVCSSQSRPDKLLDNIKGALWKNGFGKIRIIEFADSGQSKMENNKFKTEKSLLKTCTIIFRPLTGLEMDAILDASEDECLSTGDISPFRFMAHRKTIVYDVRNQKDQSAEAMIELAGRSDPRFKQLLPFAFFGDSKPGPTVNVIALENGMIAYFKTLEAAPSLKENWNRYIDEVFSNHDFIPQLAQILTERMQESAM